MRSETAEAASETHAGAAETAAEAHAGSHRHGVVKFGAGSRGEFAEAHAAEIGSGNRSPLNSSGFRGGLLGLSGFAGFTAFGTAFLGLEGAFFGRAQLLFRGMGAVGTGQSFIRAIRKSGIKNTR